MLPCDEAEVGNTRDPKMFKSALLIGCRAKSTKRAVTSKFNSMVEGTGGHGVVKPDLWVEYIYKIFCRFFFCQFD